MGQRTQAVLVAGLLALSSASPAVALAQEPDQQQEGAAVPDPVAVAAPPAEPVFDPGGTSTEVPFSATPAPEVPAAALPPADDAGSVESEPATDEAPPTADAGDGSDTQVANSELPVPAAEPVVPPPPSQPPAAQPGTGVITPSQDASEPVPNPAPLAADDHAPAHEDAPARARMRTRPVQTVPLTNPDPPPNAKARLAEPTPPAQAQPAAENAPATAATATAATTATTPIQTRTFAAIKRKAAARGDRSHVVQPGESLWSIAGDGLGDDASTARIAREVNRLWELNRSRIATGNPDLLAIGTKLVLR